MGRPSVIMMVTMMIRNFAMCALARPETGAREIFLAG